MLKCIVDYFVNRLNIKHLKTLFITSAHVNKPKNLQVFADDDTNNVVLTWDNIDGVSEFFVKVSLGWHGN